MAVDPVAKKLSEASPDVDRFRPKKGERFRCENCGMEIELIADCRCKEDHNVRLQCCGSDLSRA